MKKIPIIKLSKKNTLIKCAAALSILSITASSLAATVNPYNYTVFENAINDAKWQRGSDSEEQCSGTACESTLNDSTNQKYIWADSSTEEMYFSTNGSQVAKWRSELRFQDSFTRGSTRTFTAQIGYWASKSTSTGFTVAQLHMESDDDYSVEGPPARLEIIDEDRFEVQWRNSYSCTDDCWSSDTFATSTSGWKDIQLKTSGDYINVSVEGQTFSYNLKASGTNWPSQGGYYWKTGIYLQKAGTAYTGYKNIYW